MAPIARDKQNWEHIWVHEIDWLLLLSKLYLAQ